MVTWRLLLLIAPYCLKQLGHQLLLAVKATCDPFPNVLSSQHFQNDQVFIPDKYVNPSELTEEEGTDWHSPLVQTSLMSQKVMWNLQNNW